MGLAKGLVDEFGIIKEIFENVPSEFHCKFLDSISELEDNDAFKHWEFPKSRFHKMENTNREVFRFDIDKATGWRVIATLEKDSRMHLKALSYPSDHDDANKVVKRFQYRFSAK